MKRKLASDKLVDHSRNLQGHRVIIVVVSEHGGRSREGRGRDVYSGGSTGHRRILEEENKGK